MIPAGTLSFELLVSFSTLIQLVFYSITVLLVRKFHRPGLWPLLALSLAFFMGKAEDLWQSTGLIYQYPAWAFSGGIIAFLQGPLIFLYVQKRIRLTLGFDWKMLLHAIWLAPAIAFLWQNWWAFDRAEKVARLSSGELFTITSLVMIPVYFDLVLILYLVLSVKQLKQHGIHLQNWFSNIEDRNLSGLRHLLSMFAILVLIHLVWTLGRYFVFGDVTFMLVTIVLISYHFILINGLFLEFVSYQYSNQDQQSAPAEIEPQSQTPGLPDTEDDSLVSELNRLLDEERLYLDPDITVSDLAKPLKIHPRTLSQLINRHHQCNFHEFINRLRIQCAKDQIKSEPSKTILQVAYDSGFNSKSAFNTAFKRYVELTPSGFRKMVSG